MHAKCVPESIFKTIYVTLDGREFSTRQDAIDYEANYIRSQYNYPYLPTIIDDPLQDSYVSIFIVDNEEDWNYLWYVEWEQNICGEDYSGPGYYGAYRIPGCGDGDDSYEIIKVDNLINKLEGFLQELKDLTSDQD